MPGANIIVATLSDEHLDSLHPLVDEFASTHRSLRFKDAYWTSFRDGLVKKRSDQETRALTAEVDGELSGFALATIQENGPLVMPERIGYVSLIVVAPKSRRTGVGDALWNGMRDWFLSRGIRDVELYTEVGNDLSNAFWERRGFTAFLVRRRRSLMTGP
ncbi:MAG: GNAT family N-acetyltransferase [Candidatus Rokubacteria bacterium]|nr:GNAT family N-acetyltransferase [Candidatus Rokubacteria bacterium]